MKKTTTVGAIAVASTLILTGCGQIQPSVQDQVPTDAMVKEDAMVQEDASPMMKKDAMEKAGIYANYSTSAVDSALASGKKVALFFHAPWCPSCKSADSKFSQEILSPDTIVFKTDYDTNVELKKKYGVTSQHTFVSLNSDGSMMKKASGISTAAEVAELF